MATLHKINSRARSQDNTGFGTNTSLYGGRLVQKDGQPNVEKKGIPLLDRISWYHYMISIRRSHFFLILLFTYITLNLLFAGVYYLIGTEHLVGIRAGTEWEKFSEVFFFSTQTFTTVGYGRISPVGFWASAVATFEAFLGLLNLAIATGLFYGRFSRPQAFLKFSENALIAPYRDGVGLMLRLVPYKNNYLTDAEVRLTLAVTTDVNGTQANKFYPLELELDKVVALALSWTVVHPIGESSPLTQLRQKDLADLKAEILVFVKAFDESFSNVVQARTSYTASEILYGEKFSPMFHRSDDELRTILELDKLNDHRPADISNVYPEFAREVRQEASATSALQ